MLLDTLCHFSIANLICFYWEIVQPGRVFLCKKYSTEQIRFLAFKVFKLAQNDH